MKIEVIKPFGPTIVKLKIPNDIVNEMNNYADDIINNEKKSEELNEGPRLAGNVSQEFLLDTDFMKKIDWANFLGKICARWIKNENGRDLKNFKIIKSWIVRQFKNEYNPVHFHDGFVSAVGYLKVPKNLTSSKKKVKTNGTIDFISGTKTSLSNSIHNHTPKKGDMIIFPNNLMHTAYPFNVDGERRSFSFNLDLDNKTKKLLNV